MMIKLGTRYDSTGILPLSDQLTVPIVKSALQTLKDPEQRLLNEFFWFWPCFGTSKDDLALKALRDKKYQAAIEVWCNTTGEKTGIAIHNLAVFYHLGAIDNEIRRSAARTPSRAEDKQLWTSAFKYWKALMERSDFWDSLAQRIREIDDPRLKIETAHRIWSSLPNAISGINVRLAIAAAEAGDFEEAGEQRRYVYNSGFANDSVNKEMLRGLAPLRDEIDRLCERTEAEAVASPKTGDITFRKFLVAKSNLLQTFNFLIGVGNPVCDAVHDRIAEAGRVCLVAYVRETKDWENARLLFEECLALAEGQALRRGLEEDLEIIAGNISSGRSSPSSPPRNQSSQGSASPAQSTQTAQSAPARPVVKSTKWSKGKVVGVAVASLVLLLLTIKACNDGPSSSEQMSQPSPSISSPQVSASTPESIPDAGNTPTPSQPNTDAGSTTESQNLKMQIDEDQVMLTNLEADIRRSRSVLDDTDITLASDKAALERMKTNQNIGLDVDVDEYERIRHRYNSAVNLYNAQVNEYNGKLAQHRQLLASTNAKIDRYNSLRRSR
jgi:hypothetical protein